MEQRRSIPWAWALLTIVVVVIVGALAYYLGAHHAQPLAFARPFRMVHDGFGFGILGFWLPVLVIALLVGLLVAALSRPTRPPETFAEWHRRAHGQGPDAMGPGASEPPAHSLPLGGPASASDELGEESQHGPTSA